MTTSNELTVSVHDRQCDPWHRVLQLAIASIVSGMLLVSSYSHIFHSYQFLESVLQFQILHGWQAVVVASVLPGLQLALGASLAFVPPLRRYAYAICIPMFVIFLGFQISALVRGLEISCGCFGVNGPKIGWNSISIAALGLLLSIFGWIGLHQRGGGHATQVLPNRSGFSLLELLVVLAILSLLLGLILAAVQNVRAAAARADCLNRMKQVGLALQQFHGSHNRLPPGLSIRSEKGRYPYLGWTARILSYLEHQPIFAEAEFAFASDPDPLVFYGHAPHARLLATPIPNFACPSDPRVPGPGQVGIVTVAHTSYLGVEGTNQFLHDGLLFLDSNIRFADVHDGLSQTLCVGERPPSADLRMGWWYRGWGQNKNGSAEMILGVREINETRTECEIQGHRFSPGRIDRHCDFFHFWSLHSGGANFAFADGSVRFLKYSAEAILPALGTRAGRETIADTD